MISPIAVAIGILSVVTASPTSRYVVHEKREIGNSAWVPVEAKLNGRTTIPLSIGLTQRNLEKGHDFLMDVSDPTSPNYGKHWTPEQVAETFAPAKETIDSVKAWLAENGISEERISLSKGSMWIKVDSTIDELEVLLKTKYKIFEHSDTKQQHVACDEYSLPDSLRPHVDFITPTVHFDVVVKREKKRASVSSQPPPHISPTSLLEIEPLVGELPETATGAAFNLSVCSTHIFPECVRALYNIPIATMDKTSFGIVEYTPYSYLQSDLDLYWKNFSTNIPVGTGPGKIRLIDGAVLSNVPDVNLNAEPDLDFQIAIPLVYPQKVTLYQVGDPIEGASFNNFLDALDGSYCTSGGGDVPNVDGIYPDQAPGGYHHKADCGTVDVASVISTSYTYDEAELTAAYEIRQCNEYLKLGLQGVTILYSSGDYGVASGTGQCCTNAGCAGGTFNAPGAGGSFAPSFPSTCPYVTSVGATQIVPGAAITDPEEASETIIYSGGGFSNVFPMPSYQASALKAYFKNNSPDYSSVQYNNSQTVRGIPDISANGVNYACILAGERYSCFGTSVSTPIIGSIITLINEQRVHAGKGPVGFINPVLYANPWALNDVKKGGNRGCGTSGFRAVTGWDPVTGLGTPDYEKLLDVFMTLP